jgi:hypothetical protein
LSSEGICICGRICLWQHGEHDVEPLGHEAADVAGLETQALEAAPGDGVVAQPDEVGPQLHAHHIERARRAGGLAAQPVVQREREVALAGAEVDDVERRGGAEPGRLQRVRHHLDELVDLLPLARHRRHQLVARGGDAQFDEEGRVQADEAVLLAIVLRDVLVAGGRHHAARRIVRIGLGAMQRVATLAAHHQLQLGIAREQVRVRETRAHEGRDRLERGGHGLVLRDVPGAVLEDERQLALPAQHQRPRRDALEVIALGHRLAEQHARDAAIGHPLRQRLEKALALRQVGQGRGARIQRRRVGGKGDGFRRHGQAAVGGDAAFSRTPRRQATAVRR